MTVIVAVPDLTPEIVTSLPDTEAVATPEFEVVALNSSSPPSGSLK